MTTISGTVDDAIAWDHGLLDSWLHESWSYMTMDWDCELLPCMGQGVETLQSLQSGTIEDGVWVETWRMKKHVKQKKEQVWSVVTQQVSGDTGEGAQLQAEWAIRRLVEGPISRNYIEEVGKEPDYIDR